MSGYTHRRATLPTCLLVVCVTFQPDLRRYLIGISVVSEGSLRVHGLRGATAAALQVSIVSQEPVLFAESIMYNITFGVQDPDSVPLAQVRHVVKGTVQDIAFRNALM